MNLDTTFYLVIGGVVTAAIIPSAVVLYGGWRESRRQQAALTQRLAESSGAPVHSSLPPPIPGYVFRRPSEIGGSKCLVNRLPEETKMAVIEQIRQGVPFNYLSRDLRSRGIPISEQALSGYARDYLGIRRKAASRRRQNQENPHVH